MPLDPILSPLLDFRLSIAAFFIEISSSKQGNREANLATNFCVNQSKYYSIVRFEIVKMKRIDLWPSLIKNPQTVIYSNSPGQYFLLCYKVLSILLHEFQFRNSSNLFYSFTKKITSIDLWEPRLTKNKDEFNTIKLQAIFHFALSNVETKICVCLFFKSCDLKLSFYFHVIPGNEPWWQHRALHLTINL